MRVSEWQAEVKSHVCLCWYRLSFNGKVLRINVNQQSFEFDEDSASAFTYKSPVENPFHGDNDSRQEIFAFGLRNPWRCSLDTLNLREGWSPSNCAIFE